MPRIEPATAVANSQRKNSCPSSYGRSRRSSSCWPSCPRMLAVDGDQALTSFPGGLGKELLDPEVEPAERRGSSTFSRPSCQPSPSREPSSRPDLPSSNRHASGISTAVRGTARGRGPASAAGRARTPRAPSSAHRSRLAGEDPEEATLASGALERRAGIRDGDEPASPHRLLPEEVEVRARLERAARLRRDDEERASRSSGGRARGSPGWVVSSTWRSPRRTSAGSPRARGSSRPCREDDSAMRPRQTPSANSSSS